MNKIIRLLLVSLIIFKIDLIFSAYKKAIDEKIKVDQETAFQEYIKALDFNSKTNAVNDNLLQLPKALTQLISQYTFRSEEQIKKATEDFFIAIKKNDINGVVNAINNDANVNAINSDGDTPLTMIIELEKMDILKLLIAAGADVNKKIYNFSFHNYAPLMLACRYYWLDEIVKILIDAGANIEDEDEIGETALHKAAAAKGVSIAAKLLIDASASIDAPNIYGNTPLLVACENGNLAVVSYLLQANANVNAKNNWGETPLILAIIGKQVKIVEMLIQNNANINEKSNEGHTALTYAKAYQRKAIAQILIKDGAQE